MIGLSFKFDANAAVRSLHRAVGDEARRQATAVALNRLAARARGYVQSQMKTIFRDPTEYTKRSVRFRQATPESLEAEVYISEGSGRGISPRKFLLAEIEGGTRHDKRGERALEFRGLPDEQVVPGGAQRDAHGSLPGAQWRQILSRLKTLDSGRSGAGARKRPAKGSEYFVRRGRGGRPLGIYRVIQSGTKATPGVRGSSVRSKIEAVAVFTKRQTYRPRFPFRALVEGFVRPRFAEEMTKALNEGINHH